jgi:predicted ATPase
MAVMGTRSAVLVGRDAELASLLQAFDRARAGEAQVAVVSGEPGIGKTPLVQELVARLPEGVVVGFGHGVPLSGGAIPYGVVSDLLRSLTREVHAKLAVDVLGDATPVLASFGAAARRRIERARGPRRAAYGRTHATHALSTS